MFRLLAFFLEIGVQLEGGSSAGQSKFYEFCAVVGWGQQTYEIQAKNTGNGVDIRYRTEDGEFPDVVYGPWSCWGSWNPQAQGGGYVGGVYPTGWQFNFSSDGNAVLTAPGGVEQGPYEAR